MRNHLFLSLIVLAGVLGMHPATGRAELGEWSSYIAGPATRLNAPAVVLYSQGRDGTVNNPAAALIEDGSVATLTRTGPDSPRLALDFGRPFSGKIEIVFGSPITAPLGIAFSQRAEFLDIGSDTTAFKLGDLTVTGRAGMTWRTDARRGFRYALLYLPANGTVAIDAVRVYHTPYLGTPETYAGRFLCNDDLLNRIWYGCIYTVELCTTNGYGLDGPWEIEDGMLSVSYAGGDEFGFCVGGNEWTDYALDFDFRIMPAGKVCGWAFRGSSQADTYMWQIVAAESPVNANTLRRHVRQGGNWVSITSAPLPNAVHEGQLYHLRTELDGQTIRTWLDGQLIDTWTDATFSAGRIGFRTDPSEHFHVDNVAVTQDDVTLLNDTFDPPGRALTLDGSRWERAELLTINDGAKRDRFWYGGDFYPSQRAMYVAHYEPEVVAGTLRDAAAHQFSQATEDQYGGILRGKLPASNSGQYSTENGFIAHWLDDYTFWMVLTLHHHWMRTGDTALVEELYPNLLAVMEWAERKTGADGLIQLDQGDWYWSFLRTGEATAFNALYVRTLRCAAEMAAATGRSDDAAAWTGRADAVRTAMNTHLYDSVEHLYWDSQADHDHHPLDANTLTILYGIADDAKIMPMLDRIAADMWGPHGTRSSWPPYDTWGHNQQVWPWYVQYEVEARFQAHDDARALEAIRRPWGLMVNGDPGRTMWEFITGDGGVENGLRNTDHAFSAGAAWLLSEYVAGIRPTAPGFVTFDIVPHPGELNEVSCIVPTPRGGAAIDYAIDRPQKTYRATITVPPGSRARLGVPRLDERALITLDGQVVWNPLGPVGDANGDERYLYFPNVSAGAHLLEAIFGPAIVRPDLDRDGDVDQSDFGRFQACLTGAGVAQTDAACADARLDDDPDVDDQDLIRFRACFSGEAIPPTPGCDQP